MSSDFESQLREYRLQKTKYYQIIPPTVTDTTPSVSSSPYTAPRTDNAGHIDTERCCSFGIGEGPAKNSVYLCRLPLFGGTPLHIHYFWPVIILVMTMSGLVISTLHGLYAFIICCPVLFGSVLLHEIGHASMAVYYGGRVKLILLWPLGGVAYLSMFGAQNPFADALVALAGPATHIPQVLFWLLLMAISNGGKIHMAYALTWNTLWLQVCAGAISTQLAIFLFNLLPAFPLDGGRILAACLAMRNFEENSVFKICSALGGGIGCVILLQSISTILSGSQSMYFGWSSLLIAVFLLTHSRQLWIEASEGKALAYVN